jgi:hypothetical protein
MPLHANPSGSCLSEIGSHYHFACRGAVCRDELSAFVLEVYEWLLRSDVIAHADIGVVER